MISIVREWGAIQPFARVRRSVLWNLPECLGRMGVKALAIAQKVHLLVELLSNANLAQDKHSVDAIGRLEMWELLRELPSFLSRISRFEG